MSEKKVLIVEDEQISGLEIRGMIEDLGYNVCGIESNGKAAVKYVREHPVDLIIMDIKLPGELNGIEAIKKIKGTGEDLPFIYLSAYSDDEYLEKAKETEPASYLVKPVAEEDLKTAIEMAL